VAPEPGSVAPVECPRHRNVRTYLRCGRCGAAICPKCLVHTPVGARCPTCARPAGGLPSLGLLVYGRSIGAGVGVGAMCGAFLAVIQFGALAFLPMLLMGFLVGEAVSAAGRRRPARELAVIAFLSAVVGPVAGRALVFWLLTPIADPAIRASFALSAAFQALGAFGVLLAIVAGVIASSRVSG